MNLEIKQDLASNWFKILQNAFCDDIIKLERNKLKFKSTVWKRSHKKDEGGGEYKIKIPMIKEKRSLNLSTSVAIVLSENIRQTNYIWNK